MGVAQSTTLDAIRRFWDKYLNQLHKDGVKPPFDAWHVKRAEAFIKRSSKRLAEHSPTEIERYLRDAGRDPRLKAWQFRQIVDAIRTLFAVAGVSWLGEVDWDHWRASARTLEKAHPTVARSFDVLPQGSNAARDPRTDKGSLQETRNAHPALVESIRTAARRKGLAVRTEQGYEHWILRFLVFHRDKEVGSLGPADVGAYLDFLALRRNVSASTQNIALNALVFLFREGRAC